MSMPIKMFYYAFNSALNQENKICFSLILSGSQTVVYPASSKVPVETGQSGALPLTLIQVVCNGALESVFLTSTP